MTSLNGHGPGGESVQQQLLVAAQHRIDMLVQRESILTQKVIALGQAAEHVRRFAHHDALTGLPNRRLLLDRFNHAIALGAREHKQVALMFLDLDGFKRINDTLGHVTGDKLLQQVATRLTAGIRSYDTACRYGGDEFVVLRPELDGQESGVAAAARIRAHMEPTYLIDGAAIKITMSIGIAVYPADGNQYAELVHVADRAMYRDKARGPAAAIIRDSALSGMRFSGMRASGNVSGEGPARKRGHLVLRTRLSGTPGAAYPSLRIGSRRSRLPRL